MEKGVIKRNGNVAKFDKEKITNAIFNAARSVGGTDRQIAEQLAGKVIEQLLKSDLDVPTVEDVQDFVEKVLIESGHAKTAKSFILYRQKRAEVRKEKAVVLEKTELDEVDKRFDLNALRILKSRYLRKDEDGKLIESPKQLFTRVAVHVTLPNLLYDDDVYDNECCSIVHGDNDFDEVAHENCLSVGKYKLNRYHLQALKRMFERFNKSRQMKVGWSEFIEMLADRRFDKYEKNIDDFYEIMSNKRFMPNTPAVANFGNVLGMGSACFVIGIDDSMESIMETLKQASFIFKSGGGMGYNFSKLRPEGDYVSSTSGVASGPISFIRLFDTMTDVVKQGGIRRGANMGILNSNHPDIEKFITAKEGNKALRNFNISVLVMPELWECVKEDKPYPLINPRTGKVFRTTNARALLDRLVYQAWESGEPGVVFYDTINKYNPFLEHLGPIMSTNPCGEVPLYPYESCNLGSLNLLAFVEEGNSGEPFFNWDLLKSVIISATCFLDNIIDVNKLPLKQIEEFTLKTRKIGMGVMGLGDMLYAMGIAYNSEKARDLMEEIMEFINYYSKSTSVEIAKKRGPFPHIDKSFYPQGKMPFAGFYDKDSWHFDWEKLIDDVKKYGIRNGFTTVIAPTGSISMIVGSSSGIEPVFSLVFEKHVKVGDFYYVDPVFEDTMKKHGLYDEQLMKDVCDSKGSIHNISYIPQNMRDVFITAHEITPEEHVRTQAAFQKWVDAAISKTNNFPADATVDDMRKSYELAYQLGCKGITVYRDSSIKNQVLVAPARDDAVKKVAKETVQEPLPSLRKEPVAIDNPVVNNPADNYNNHKMCPSCGAGLLNKEGCISCPACGWGICSG